MAQAASARDEATRGAWMALAGCLIVPATVVVVAVAPQDTRVAVFLVGFTLAATVAIAGGVVSRRALLAGTPHRVRAFVAAVGGLVVGITTGVIVAVSLAGLVL
jgi:hypothetical protein